MLFVIQYNCPVNEIRWDRHSRDQVFTMKDTASNLPFLDFPARL
jgi:hypothetical protein